MSAAEKSAVQAMEVYNYVAAILGGGASVTVTSGGFLVRLGAVSIAGRNLTDVTLRVKKAVWDKSGCSLPYLEPTTNPPSFNTMEKWEGDGMAGATDGCRVEPDGYCEHCHVSWLVYKGLI